MDMQVGDFLAGIQAGIHQQTIARRDMPGLTRDLADGAHISGDFHLARPRREIVPAHIGALGDDEDGTGACGAMS